MSLPSAPPKEARSSVRRGATGWLVFAIQRALRISADGNFGPQTEAAVKSFQSSRTGMVVDGIAGPATQKAMALAAIKSAELVVPTPDGLLYGIVESESGMLLEAINDKVTGGVDCGVVQRRVYGPPYSLAKLKEAFDPEVAASIALSELRTRAKGYAGTREPREREWRLAAMAHNWPVAGGASYIAEHGKCSNPDGACSWLPRNGAGQLYIKFPDGVLVKTRWEWCQFYAMGGPHGEGKTARFVDSWSA